MEYHQIQEVTIPQYEQGQIHIAVGCFPFFSKYYGTKLSLISEISVILILFQRNDLRCLSRTLIYDFCVDLGVLDALMGQHSADSENVNTVGCKERGEAVAHRVESDASG